MPEPDPSISLTVQLLFLALLILVNAFFAAAEMAVVSANKNKIKVLAQEGNKKAKLLLKLYEEPNKFLSTIQVAITLAGFLSSAVAATSMSDDIGAFVTRLGIPYGPQIAIVLVTLILSFITLVFGELYPKRMALQYSERIALFCVNPILFISKLSKPFVWLLSKSVTLLLRITGVKDANIEEQYSEEEIRSLLEVGQETGLIKETGKEMITSIFEFDDKLAYEVMTPRTDVYMININDNLADYVDELLEERYARIPVFEKDSDNIIGILYMKDFIIEARKHGFEQVDIKSLLRKPYLVPESKNIDDLFRELQETKVHIALLIDEYGGFSGIVTIEDLIEEVMGNIEDEDDEFESKLEKLDDNIYLVDGQYYIDDLNDELLLDLESEEHETIGGLIIDLLGEIPDEDETEERIVEFGNCVFKIESVKDRRIDKVKLFIAPETKNDDGEEKE
ncbi:HlyC/CorC family transporter [Anoxybacterium hadale]|uniref:HlyC/CorC family transporter n=1 Tax=Anoxybacterium hadale TaxID=3408580 RepID=A0ACD1A8U1_9FIRM|nr:HlyC/CorC family transporter [Clostridiales bacterium]